MMTAQSPRPRYAPPRDLEAPPGCRCAPRQGTSPQGAARAWSMPCWICPRSGKAHAWRRHSGLATASHCTGSRNAARTSVHARPGGARSWMRTFRPAAPGSTSRAQPARNPCQAHNDVRGDRPVRQPRRRPGPHETGQHNGLQRRQILRRHRRPRHPQISYGCQAQTRASSPSPSQQNERSRRHTFRNPEFTSDGRTRIDRARRPRYWVYRGTGGLRELWGHFFYPGLLAVLDEPGAGMLRDFPASALRVRAGVRCLHRAGAGCTGPGTADVRGAAPRAAAMREIAAMRGIMRCSGQQVRW
jgi:hypothetical protein